MDHMHVSGISLSSVNVRWRLFDPERGRWAAIFVGTDEYFLPSLVRPVHLFPPLPKSEYLFSTAKKKKKKKEYPNCEILVARPWLQHRTCSASQKVSVWV